MASQVARDVLTVLFGALAGGLTNRIAILMLFHPYRPPRVLGRPVGWLQGAIPKNQGRLARTIGNTIGTRLLTAEDVAAELRDERLHDAFEAQLQALIEELFAGEQPSLEELLPESALPEIRRIVESFLDHALERVLESLDSEAFAESSARILSTLAESLEGESLAESIGPERLREMRERADAWLAGLVESESFLLTLRQHLQRVAGELLRPDRSFQELLPVGLVAAVEHAISDYLPLAMERLGRLLEDPRARHRFERAIHDLLDRFMQDLRFHQRVVAKLIITEDTVDRVIDTLEAEGTDRLGELLREPEVQDAIARSVNEAIVEFLRRPVVQVLGEADSDQVRSGIDAITMWATRTLRDPAVRVFLLDRAESALLRAGERSWADVVRLVPAERAGGWAAAGLRSEASAQLADRAKTWLTDRILSRPIGGLGAFGRADTARRLTGALSGPVWAWISGKVPEVAANVRVSERVEEKIVEFPIRDLEQLVRNVTQSELNLIVRLGYVLGAVIGTALVGIRWLLA